MPVQAEPGDRSGPGFRPGGDQHRLAPAGPGADQSDRLGGGGVEQIQQALPVDTGPESLRQRGLGDGQGQERGRIDPLPGGRVPPIRSPGGLLALVGHDCR
jgi:hypothetical protein